ncbi:MAG TPA: sulfur carrier protein ThiS [Nitrospira sp.]|jgi:sulfur carrier protein|nr:sulfur carrier protein ThiS [Nitrospira sp.]
MQVRINGKSEEVQNGTVLDLLMMKKIEPQMVAVEVNDKVLERDHLATTRLNEGDQIEFLFYMGGGR